MALGELERAVMGLLWAAAHDLAATELRAALSERDLALTTVHTVLSRLQTKGFVAGDAGRPRRFRALGTKEEHIAAVMHEVLGDAEDRQAVLARFVSDVSPEEVALLRSMLEKN